MKKKRLISLLLAAFITVMPLSFSFAAPTPEPTADNTTSTVTSPDGTTRTVTSDGNDVKSTPKATESTDTSSDTETTSATETPSDTHRIHQAHLIQLRKAIQIQHRKTQIHFRTA